MRKKLFRVIALAFFSNAKVRAKKAWTVTTLASDHVPVVTEIELR
jgi:hypothetical protein